ncbi:MAG: aminotransferase class I/II-fold pyridoxal phosphate-dependent enzyme, partial [Candidatus Omnitrophica bacterium]|nr:aminotransferase class I/II-fold pyridoxal phosphate-dependent enzyme [Candidatus Omnitrophota bacterium]
ERLVLDPEEVFRIHVIAKFALYRLTGIGRLEELIQGFVPQDHNAVISERSSSPLEEGTLLSTASEPSLGIDNVRAVPRDLEGTSDISLGKITVRNRVAAFDDESILSYLSSEGQSRFLQIISFISSHLTALERSFMIRITRNTYREGGATSSLLFDPQSNTLLIHPILLCVKDKNEYLVPEEYVNLVARAAVCHMEHPQGPRLSTEARCLVFLMRHKDIYDKVRVFLKSSQPYLELKGDLKRAFLMWGVLEKTRLRQLFESAAECLLDLYRTIGFKANPAVTYVCRFLHTSPQVWEESIQEKGAEQIRAELRRTAITLVYEGRNAVVYRATILGNEFMIKEIKNQRSWEQYRKGENILGAQVAQYILIEGLETNLGGKRIVLPQAVVQENVTFLIDLINRINLEHQFDNENRIKAQNKLLNGFLALVVELLKLCIIPKTPGFLKKYGVCINITDPLANKIVVVDVADLNFLDAIAIEHLRFDNFRTHILLGMTKEDEVYPDRPSGLQVMSNFMNELIVDPLLTRSLVPNMIRRNWNHQPARRVVYLGSGMEISQRIYKARKDFIVAQLLLAGFNKDSICKLLANLSLIAVWERLLNNSLVTAVAQTPAAKIAGLTAARVASELLLGDVTVISRPRGRRLNVALRPALEVVRKLDVPLEQLALRKKRGMNFTVNTAEKAGKAGYRVISDTLLAGLPKEAVASSPPIGASVATRLTQHEASSALPSEAAKREAFYRGIASRRHAKVNPYSSLSGTDQAREAVSRILSREIFQSQRRILPENIFMGIAPDDVVAMLLPMFYDLIDADLKVPSSWDSIVLGAAVADRYRRVIKEQSLEPRLTPVTSRDLEWMQSAFSAGLPRMAILGIEESWGAYSLADSLRLFLTYASIQDAVVIFDITRSLKKAKILFDVLEQNPDFKKRVLVLLNLAEFCGVIDEYNISALISFNLDIMQTSYQAVVSATTAGDSQTTQAAVIQVADDLYPRSASWDTIPTIASLPADPVGNRVLLSRLATELKPDPTVSVSSQSFLRERGVPRIFAGQALSQEELLARIIPMHQGAPKLPLPELARDAVGRAIEFTHGDVVKINLLVRQAMAHYAQEVFHLSDAEAAYGYYGSKSALQAFVRAIQRLDYRKAFVFVPTPSFAGYPPALEMVLPRERIVYFPTLSRNGFIPTADQIMRVKEDTVRRQQDQYHEKILLLASPGNPTSTVMTAEQARAIMECAEDQGMYVILDVAYGTLLFGEDPIRQRPVPLGEII